MATNEELRRMGADLESRRKLIESLQTKVGRRPELGPTILREQEELTALSQRYEQETGLAAESIRAYRPKSYNTGGLRPGQGQQDRVRGGYTGIKGASGDPRIQTIGGKKVLVSVNPLTEKEIRAREADRARLKEIQVTPGIAKFKSEKYQRLYGNAAFSQLGTGEYLTPKKEKVYVKEPIGQTTTGAFIYPETPKVQEQLFSSPINYSSDVGISTPTGYSLFYPSEAFKSQAQKRFEYKQSVEQQLAGDVTSRLFTGPFSYAKLFAAKESTGLYGAYGLVKNNNLVRGVSSGFTTGFTTGVKSSINIDRQFYDTSKIITINEKSGRPKRVLYGLVDSPNQLLRNPYGEAISYTETAATGFGFGVSTGAVSEFIGVKAAQKTALKTTTAQGIAQGTKYSNLFTLGTGGLFVGAAGVQAYREPEQFGRDIPKNIIGIATFGKGYGLERSKPIISYGKTQITSARTKTDDLGFISKSTFRTPIKVQQYGLTTKGIITQRARTASILKTGMTPTSTSYETFTTVKSQQNIFGKTITNVADFTGRATITSKGNVFTIKNINNGQLGVSGFTGDVRGGTLQSINLVPKKESYAVTSQGLGNIKLSNVRTGRAYNVFYESTGTVRTSAVSGTGEVQLFTRGLKGFEPAIKDRTRPIFNLNKKGQFAISRPRAIEEDYIGNRFLDTFPREETTVFNPQRTIVESPTRTRTYSRGEPRNIIPALATPKVQAPSFARPIGLFGARSPSSTKNNYVSKDYSLSRTMPFSMPKSLINTNTFAKVTPISTSSTINLFDTGTKTTPTIASSRITPVPIVIPGITPPKTPGFPGLPFGLTIPSLGLSGGSRDYGGGTRRKYQYTQSLAASVLKIRGKQPKFLTGLELRPIIKKKKRK